MAIRKPAHWQREKSAFGCPGLVSPDGHVFACLTRDHEQIMVNFDDHQISVSLYLPIGNVGLGEQQRGPVRMDSDRVYAPGFAIPIPRAVLLWLQSQAEVTEN